MNQVGNTFLGIAGILLAAKLIRFVELTRAGNEDYAMIVFTTGALTPVIILLAVVGLSLKRRAETARRTGPDLAPDLEDAKEMSDDDRLKALPDIRERGKNSGR